MRFLVLGAGALGGFFGARLLKGGADVTFLVRPKRAGQLDRDGLIVKFQDGEVFGGKVKTVQQGGIDGSYDVVLLTCKAYDLDDAINAIAPAMGPQSAVLPLLNGISHIDVLKQKFGAQRVLGGLTVINAALLPDGSIQQSQLRVNITEIGELDGQTSARCDAIRAALAAGGIAVDVKHNIVVRLWAKFCGFACNAALATLTRSRAGGIARSGAGAAFVANMLDECARVVTVEGYPPPPDVMALIPGIFAQKDSTYGPSMLIDMEDGRATEGDHTIGDLAQRAARHGIAAPLLNAAWCNLQAYEINRANKR
jgi:2-dehydropantoate 2-reductase